MFFFFFFNDTATTEIYPLSLPDALPIYPLDMTKHAQSPRTTSAATPRQAGVGLALGGGFARGFAHLGVLQVLDRKSTRLNSSHSQISYAVFCLKKKTKRAIHTTTPATWT